MPAHLFAKQGPFEGLILDFEDGEDWIIGRDPDEADFVLEDSTVSRKHARITKAAEGLVLRNLSRINPTLVNGQIDEDDILLTEGDEIQIGDTTFLFSEHEKTSAQENREENPEEPPLLKEPQEPTAYDTIFDDSEAERELPFHMVPDSPLLLKVISGPNAGAEIGIETDRTYVLGKDPNTCDIVFQDLSVSRNHARLNVDPDGIVDIEDLGSKNGTLINGHSILEKTVVTPQDVISLGTTLFLFIDREAPQETIFSTAPSHFAAHEEEKPAFTPAEAAQNAEEETELTDWKKAKIPPKYLIAASGFALIFFIIFISFFSLFKSNTLEIVQNEPVEEIEQALKPFSSVQFSFNPASGKLFLVGHVSTNIQFQELHYNINQIPFITDVEDTVIIDEMLSKTMNDLLNSHGNWRGVSISAPQPGQFIVSGYIQTAAEGQALSDYLLMNFPYSDKLTNRVAIEEILSVQVTNLILSHGFTSLSFQLNQGSIILSGLYSEEREKEYLALIKNLNSLPGIHAVKNFATPTSHRMARINLPSEQYQVTGSSLFDGQSYSVIINGKVFTKGDFVDGMKITMIESSAILLEKDGLKYTINYAPGH
jgi:type III secretion system YscD/HrpQ family protein